MLSWMGLLFTGGALFLLVSGRPVWAGVVVLAGALFDTLDGALARETSRVSLFGGVLDSTLDRLTEGIIFVGIVFVMAREGSPCGAALAGAALLASVVVSYIRARAEAAGVQCSEGWFTRTERVIVLCLGLIFNQIIIALAVIAVLSTLTAGHRLLVVWQKTRLQQT
jgi:CDP-diacylglycerol--glycerol-3-phosphate 3-phosphatidyltransferase